MRSVEPLRYSPVSETVCKSNEIDTCDTRASKMDHWIRALATRPADLSLISRNPMVEGKNQFLQVL